MSAMPTAALCEEILMIAGAGDASDALDLSRRLVREDRNPTRAIAVRRTVTRGELDRDALRRVGEGIAEDAARQGEWVWVEMRVVAREMVASGGDSVVTRAGRELLSLF